MFRDRNNHAWLKSLIKKIAPALGGPLAGAATKFISEKLLGKTEATQQEIEEELAKSWVSGLAQAWDRRRRPILFFLKSEVRIETKRVASSRDSKKAISLSKFAMRRSL